VLQDLGSDDELDLANYKGLKKSELKKLLKERERLKKRAAKEAEKAAIAERKRRRGEFASMRWCTCVLIPLPALPLDYDRQCGVINDKGLPCSRSLTCKTHTVGAKRAVQGRTRPYDELFIEWQRAHNPNFKEPVPKKDKEAKAAAAAAAGAASSAERKAAAAKKRRAALMGDEEGLRFDEDGHREMEELIRATRVAGERVSSASRALNSGFAPTSFSSAAARPARQATYNPVWRTTTYEEYSMGDLLTKALAARPRPGGSAARLGMSSKPGPVISLVPPPSTGVTA
jgi:SAGA-associated factor 73